MSSEMPGGEWVGAFAPATIANLGPGFDILGMAVDRPGDGVCVRVRPGRPGLMVEAGFSDVPIPTDPARNTAAVAARVVLERAEAPASMGLDMRVFKGLPIGSGLGSSGASAAAAAVAVNEALGSPLELYALFEACCAAEAAACGAAHGDNVAPGLWGGAVLLRPAELGSRVGAPARVVALPVPEALRVALCTPKVEIRTSEARRVMPAHLSVVDVVFNASQIAGLVDALHRGDLEALGRALADRLHVPARSALIPGFAAVEAAALKAGALGMSISGSGPTLFALATDETAEAAAAAMKEAFEEHGVEAKAWVARAGAHGARVVPADAVATLVESFRAV